MYFAFSELISNKCVPITCSKYISILCTSYSQIKIMCFSLLVSFHCLFYLSLEEKHYCSSVQIFNRWLPSFGLMAKWKEIKDQKEIHTFNNNNIKNSTEDGLLS